MAVSDPCNHARTVQIFADVFKCSNCGKVLTSDDETLRPDYDKYARLHAARTASKRRAIARNRRTNS